MTLLDRLLIVVLLLIFVSCAPKSSEVVKNKNGGYAIEVLPDWYYTVDNSNTTILKSKSLIVQATLSVSILESEYETLEESFTEYVAQLPPGFNSYLSLGSGNTQIDNTPVMWHKMRDTEDGNRFLTLIYVMQPIGKKMILISCSALEQSFDGYEEDFTKMCFSLKKLNDE